MSDETEPLGDLLGGASAFHPEVKPEPRVEAKVEPKAEVAEVVPEPKTEVKEPIRDEQGKFARPVTEPVQTDKPLTRADVAAIIDERRKRQELERRLQEQPPQPPPSVFENEDEAIKARVEAHTSPLRGVLLQQSVEIAQLRHGEAWKDAEAGFYEAVEADPSLVEQFRRSNNPGEFVYRTGIYHREVAKYGGDVIAMRDAIRSEGNAKLDEANARIKALEAELAAAKSVQQEAATVGKSLNNRASAQVTTDTVGDDEPVSELVRFGKRG